jgi:hypothetical protein
MRICPYCKGQMFAEHEHEGIEYCCLQCGYRVDAIPVHFAWKHWKCDGKARRSLVIKGAAQ